MVLLLLASSLLPLLSWMMSAFGVPCRSLLSEEGWRWLCLHYTDALFSPWVCAFCALLVAMGAMLRSGQLKGTASVSVGASVISGLFGIVCLGLLIFAGTYSHSPLLSITGGLFPSPYIQGFPFMLALLLLSQALLYAFLTRQIRSLQDFCAFFTYGISHFAQYIVIAMLLSALVCSVEYVFLF